MNKHNKYPPSTVSSLVYGIHPCLAVTKAGKRVLHRFYLKKSRFENSIEDENIRRLIDFCNSQHVPIHVKEKSFFDRITDDVNHQGVCFDCDELQAVRMGAEHLNGFEELENQVWLFLDRVQDPGNLGAVIRSAQFFGVNKIMQPESGTSPLSAAVSKSSGGMMELANIFSVKISFLKSLIPRLRKEKWKIVSLVSRNEIEENLQENETNLLRGLEKFEHGSGSNVLIMLGNERDGVRRELRSLSTDFINIRQRNEQDAGSLNVSVCAGVVFYEMRRKRLIE